jgi:hypothetical protein
MENKIYVEMTIDELINFNNFKANLGKRNEQDLIDELLVSCKNLKREENINPNTMEKYGSYIGTYDTDEGHLYFSYMELRRNKNEH